MVKHISHPDFKRKILPFGEASFRLEIQSVDAFVKSFAFGVGEIEVSWIEML